VIAVIDGVLRLLEVRYSMFHALFVCCAALPLFRGLAQARGVEEPDPWRTAARVLRGAGGPQAAGSGGK